MRMLVMNVRHISSTVKNPELEVIVDIAVVDVGWVIWEKRNRRLVRRCHLVRRTRGRNPLPSAGWGVESGVGVTGSHGVGGHIQLIRVGRLVDQHRWIAY